MKVRKTKKCRGTKEHDCSTLIESKYQLCKKCRCENDSSGRKKNLIKFLKKNPYYHKGHYQKYIIGKSTDLELLKPEKKVPGGIAKMEELKITPHEVREKIIELGLLNKEKN